MIVTTFFETFFPFRTYYRERCPINRVVYLSARINAPKSIGSYMFARKLPFGAGVLTLLLCCAASTQGRVVINEVMYHAPADLEDLEYIELHNSADAPADIGGWAFTKGIKLKFPAGEKIPARGFVVLARNADRFKEFYGFPPRATFEQKLSNNGERLELVDAKGAVMDAVAYKDHAPWPKGADGQSGSLERISPEAPGEDPANWTSSPLAADHRRPRGTPAQINTAFQKTLPPTFTKVRFAPEDPAPNQGVSVEATLKYSKELKEVALLYRLASPGSESPETAVPMHRNADDSYAATIPGQSKDRLIRFRLKATDADGAVRFYPAETEPRPALSYYVHEALQPAKIPFAWIINTTPGELKGGNREQFKFGPWAPQGNKKPETPYKSAFIYYNPETRKTQVYDFVQVQPRKGGRKVHFYSDQPLEEMTGINLIFEYDERFPLTESLAYEVYRRAGMPAEKSYQVRTWVNGQPIGYQLLVEQPNRGFLRRHKIRDDGNLYKLLWYNQGLADQHEKKTNIRAGKEDLIALEKQLTSTKDREQWEVIKKNFDVEEVANYFAVNTALSYWDGFFNNYYTYHDAHGTGKWTMFPWDQDKTWGITDNSGKPFYNMPLTFGMNGDHPPGSLRSPGPGSFDVGHSWWRPPGWFSGPLLANAYFRRVYLTRVRDIIENIYTEKDFLPLIDAMGDRLRDDVRLRAELHREDPAAAMQRFDHNLNFMREHLKKRREFLLAQKELQSLPRTAAQP